MKKKIIIFIFILFLCIGAVGGIYCYNKSNKNSTEPDISDEMDVSNQDNIENPMEEKEYNHSQQNVTIEVKSNTITPESVEITITGNNETVYSCGVEFGVQKKINGKWENLDYVSDDLTWNALAYKPDENNQINQKLDIEKYYGKLSDGTYRIVKPINHGNILYSNEFEIK